MDTQQPQPTPIISYEQQPQAPLPQPEGRSFHVSKKVLIIIGLAVLVLVSASVFLLTRTKKSPPATTTQAQDTLLATVGDQNIYRSDVAKAALEQYAPGSVTTEVMKTMYDILIERAILDQEAKRLGIVVSDANATKTIPSSTSAAVPTALIKTQKYTLIQQQITQRLTRNVTAYTIGVWIASYEDPQIPIYTQQRADTIKALDEIQAGLQNNISPVTIAEAIYAKYPSIRPRLAVNGYIYEKTQNKDTMITPKAYTINPEQLKAPSADPYLFAELIKIKSGQIVKINRPDGTGGIVVKAVTVTSDGYLTYEEFLAAKKKELVKTVASL